MKKRGILDLLVFLAVVAIALIVGMLVTSFKDSFKTASPECPYEIEAAIVSDYTVNGIKCSLYSYKDEDGDTGTFITDENGNSLLLNKIMYNGINPKYIYLTQELWIVPADDGFQISYLKMSL